MNAQRTNSNLSAGLMLGGALIASSALHAQEHVVQGFTGPLFGLATAPNGDILVADAVNGIIAVRNGETGVPSGPAGATDVSPIGQSSLWVTTGAGADPTANTGQALHRVSRGRSREIVDLFVVEERDPDSRGVDSNPFDVESLGGHTALVVDAGGNDLLWSDNQGTARVVATFPNALVSTDNAKRLFGCPAGPPGICGLPPEIPAQPVPTSVAVGPDGFFYVGELKGFPAPTGASSIWRVSPGAAAAECGASADCTKVFDGGFTSIIDLAFGPGGTLYVAEMDESSWAAVEIPGLGPFPGGTVNACNVATATCTEVATSIPELTAITIDNDGALWATRNALGISGPPEIVRID